MVLTVDVGKKKESRVLRLTSRLACPFARVPFAQGTTPDAISTWPDKDTVLVSNIR